MLLLGVRATAGEGRSPEERIRGAAMRLERAAAPLGEAAAVARLAAAFRISPQAVTDLRDQKLDSGEIATVLALAEAARTSPDTILALWAGGRLNWGEIANRFHVDQRALLRRLDSVRRALGPRGR